MAFILHGVWQNEYGSRMTLDVSETGQIVGEYQSTTGASGTYFLVGHCRPQDPDPQQGQPLVLSIFWRPFDVEAEDDGIHWVSTYCGQLNANGEMTVINTLLTTTPYQAFEPGDYIDNLVFKKSDSVTVLADSTAWRETSQQNDNPINGVWSSDDKTIQLALAVQNQKYGVLAGELSYQGEKIQLIGFTDTYANNNILQSLTLSGYMLTSLQPISLVGRMNSTRDGLFLSRWLANGTNKNNAYFQANSMNWQFVK
ncbi:avidin/streptavidin family protein [Marinomonas posidonica]|uniref:avidin/streptavidin family protein n=1 Tax=Marinomonas posidonica TaxID=936476 RepID=UPI00373620D9